jgi:hypothetical protein
MPRSGETLGDLEIISTDPAAGAEISWTATQDCIVHNMRFTLVTDATVANRVVAVRASDGTDLYFTTHSNTNHTAGATVVYTLFGGAAVVGSLTSGILFPLPAGGLRMRKNDVLSTLTAGVVAGDNFSTAVLRVELF